MKPKYMLDTSNEFSFIILFSIYESWCDEFGVRTHFHFHFVFIFDFSNKQWMWKEFDAQSIFDICINHFHICIICNSQYSTLTSFSFSQNFFHFLATKCGFVEIANVYINLISKFFSSKAVTTLFLSSRYEVSYTSQ